MMLACWKEVPSANLRTYVGSYSLLGGTYEVLSVCEIFSPLYGLTTYLEAT